MSKLTDIIDAATNDTESIASLLRKTKVLAARLETPPLIDWVDNELDGYLDNAPLPSYRGPFHTRVISQWAGAGNSKATVPFPSGTMPKEMREHAFELEFRQTVSELDRLSKLDGPLQAPWDANILAVLNDRVVKGEIIPPVFVNLEPEVAHPGDQDICRATAIHNDRGRFPQLNHA